MTLKLGLKLGWFADDFTGATDLANNRVRAGMRVVQTINLPTALVPGVDCVMGHLDPARLAHLDVQGLQSVADPASKIFVGMR